ncbi:O-antigen ligase family protein [Pareuzebyella sediminis]|uniref:O-antigen ligase family protein n=1 Tax=Pareuzebyella sediminis TaxID=2607998 RepID=UPI0011EF4C5D|nr:O-antigen ligase family protein [Pareuzebyella sediminis]
MKELQHRGYYYGALLYVFLIPFSQKLVTLLLILWLVLSILSFNRTTTVKKRYLWLLPILFSLYFLGLYTADSPSFKFLEHKLSLLIFPLLFYMHAYDTGERNRMLKTFVWGILGAALACLAMAIYHSIEVQNGIISFQANVLEGKGFMESILYGGNYFFGRHFSIFHQTVYFALYVCTGVAVLLFRPNLFESRKRWILLASFIVVIFLVSNKASFIGLATILLLRLLTLKGQRVKKIIGFVSVFLVLATFLAVNPRIKESLEKVAEGALVLNPEARFGFATRLLTWDAAISLIKERPIWGYGYGDTQTALNRYYKEKGYIHPLKESYNAHNLWLQSWLENGILAILVLLAIFSLLLGELRNFQQDTWLLFSFVLLLLINSMFEGLFNRFSGISFFSFWVCYIFSALKEGKLRE